MVLFLSFGLKIGRQINLNPSYIYKQSLRSPRSKTGFPKRQIIYLTSVKTCGFFFLKTGETPSGLIHKWFNSGPFGSEKDKSPPSHKVIPLGEGGHSWENL